MSEPAGYVEFGFDLPDALLKKLVSVLDSVQTAPLLRDSVAEIPETQGVYQLFHRRGGAEELVYIGKTTAANGLRGRLSHHAMNVLDRIGLDPQAIAFKAVRVFVFTAVDLESQLIDHYRKVSQVSWQHSGFGSNDPGKERDTTNYKLDHFDARYPIDMSRLLEFPIPRNGTASSILSALKKHLPYLVRFHTESRWSRKGHSDLEETLISLPMDLPMTAQDVIREVVRQLPPGWHATALPSHTIVYKDDLRQFPSGREVARSPGLT